MFGKTEASVNPEPPTDDILQAGDTSEEQPEIKIRAREAAQHRRLVTLWLIALLTLVIVGHYCCVLVLEWNGKKIEALGNAFNASLPVVAGLVGSAVTYYFTRGSGSSGE